jgi:DNA repair exonuclease SbcCD ATPase subunit
MPSSPTATVDSNSSADPEIEFINPKQVEALYDLIENRYNEVQTELEAYEMMDDDIQELREMKLNQYEFAMLAEAYDAVGQKTTADGLREQAEECDERIEELQANLEDVLENVKDHMMRLVEMEIRRETYEIQMKACEKYLEKSKRKAYMETKKSTIKPASPRRYAKAASPSRLGTDFGREHGIGRVFGQFRRAHVHGHDAIMVAVEWCIQLLQEIQGFA